ncbi:nicotinamide riboside transporter PnuC [Thiomicrorhabdus sp.]|uniref:nicotinamide riboside transporter PnuC n=1 Tax=Thiomicrorhabdus sp. TaxID=2039724 RepID=UPI0029C82407|nr:nicotinamide riboside transporter PnuC [Thiomicrorhabdus sp.]
MPADFQLGQIFDLLASQSPWEWTAALLGIAYVILAARNSLWCWPAAFISTAIYSVLFWEGKLGMQAFLNLYYLGMAVYGYSAWSKTGPQETSLPISRLSGRKHLLFVSSGIVFTFIIGFWMDKQTENPFPYLDAGVMIFSLMTTVLTARRVLESWSYWLIIDSAAILLYGLSGFYVTILMFMVYLIVATYGQLHWLKLFREQNLSANPA